MPKNRFQFILALTTGFIVFFVSIALLPTDNKKSLPPNSLPADLSGDIDPTKTAGYWMGKSVIIPKSLLTDDVSNRVLAMVEREDRWIEVDLSQQKLFAWEGPELFLESLVSTGLPYYPTPKGEFRIWVKFRASTMEGGQGAYYYYLPNVPYVMFFYNDQVPKSKGYGLHGTYWHNDFGSVHSHGCVNLPTGVAQQIYYWAYPELLNGVKTIYADENNPGTKLIIHD